MQVLKNLRGGIKKGEGSLERVHHMWKDMYLMWRFGAWKVVLLERWSSMSNMKLSGKQVISITYLPLGLSLVLGTWREDGEVGVYRRMTQVDRRKRGEKREERKRGEVWMSKHILILLHKQHTTNIIIHVYINTYIQI